MGLLRDETLGSGKTQSSLQAIKMNNLPALPVYKGGSGGGGLRLSAPLDYEG